MHIIWRNVRWMILSDKIPKVEAELLFAAIEKIVMQEVLENEVVGVLPKIDELNDSNKIYRGKVSVLFVDMRESTKLPEKYSADQLVKIYRSYIRVVVQAIRKSGGVVRDFMGDGVLALFVDNEDGLSEDKAVHAARYIATAIDKFLNPVLDSKIKHRISCGIGINTGEVSLSKVGMRGKESDDNSENEFGIAWIGNCTNLACKQSSAVECGAIFISHSTFANLSDDNKHEKWKSVEMLKGKNLLKGYIAEKYYLSLDEDIEPFVAPISSPQKTVVDSFEQKMSDIIQRTETLGKMQQQLNEKIKQINEKEKTLDRQEQDVKQNKYYFYCNVLGSGHCKDEYVKIMGLDFWEENLKQAIAAGKALGKTERKVKQDVSYAMVSIYEALELYDKAYDFLVEQAAGYSWLSVYNVQKIVNKVKYYSRLLSAVCERLEMDDLSDEDRLDFEKIKRWLSTEYKI